ncbi:MAG TPA: methyltransferase domain-containing protein [Gaiellaceae bacterium]|nr:methyltransferase domain-containing protein [Gaiellaceae bacterium]
MSLGERYGEHHRRRRAEGDFVFVPERIPFFQAAIGRGRRVLDLGCRSGALTRHLLEGNEVVGLDVDEAALAKAAALGIQTVVADAEEPLPFPDASFDAVVAGELLEHLRFPDALVAEVRRLLRPGGVFVGSVPNAFRLQSRLRFLRGRPPEDDPTHLRLFSPAALRALLVGFEDVRLAFLGGRYRRLHPRLLARDLAFRAVRP